MTRRMHQPLSLIFPIYRNETMAREFVGSLCLHHPLRKKLLHMSFRNMRKDINCYLSPLLCISDKIL